MATDDLTRRSARAQRSKRGASSSRSPFRRRSPGVLGLFVADLRRLGAGRRRSARRRADDRGRRPSAPKAADADRGRRRRRRPRRVRRPERRPAAPRRGARHARPSPSSTAPPASARRCRSPARARSGRAPARAAPARSLAPRRHPEDRRRTARGRPRPMPAPVKPLSRQAGRAAHRDRGRRPRRQRATPRNRRMTKLPGAGDLRVRALRHRDRPHGGAARAPTATRCCCRCRWSRSTIPTTIPARRRC